MSALNSVDSRIKKGFNALVDTSTELDLDGENGSPGAFKTIQGITEKTVLRSKSGHRHIDLIEHKISQIALLAQSVERVTLKPS